MDIKTFSESEFECDLLENLIGDHIQVLITKDKSIFIKEHVDSIGKDETSFFIIFKVKKRDFYSFINNEIPYLKLLNEMENDYFVFTNYINIKSSKIMNKKNIPKEYLPHQSYYFEDDEDLVNEESLNKLLNYLN